MSSWHHTDSQQSAMLKFFARVNWRYVVYIRTSRSTPFCLQFFHDPSPFYSLFIFVEILHLIEKSFACDMISGISLLGCVIPSCLSVCVCVCMMIDQVAASALFCHGRSVVFASILPFSVPARKTLRGCVPWMALDSLLLEMGRCWIASFPIEVRS